VTTPDSRPGRESVPVIWGNVPQRNKNFTGRADILTDLRQGVSASVIEVLPHALQGMGGVGKTAVAIEYAHRYRSQYDLVWWIPADQPALVRSSLAALAQPLGLQQATAARIEMAASAVLDALRRGEPYARWLLIFDNADQPEDLNDIIPRGPGDVLITSRNHRWEAVVETVAVDVFTRAESIGFLARRVPKSLPESQADQLAEELGDLPLALEQAGALQAETGMSVDEYLRLLHEHTAEIMSEGQSAEYPRSMTAAWKLSVATLNRQLPQAMELLRCCAFLGPQPIPRDIFRRGSQATQTRVSDLLANPILLARAIRELGRFALIKIDGRRIQVHRLIQALLRDELAPEEQATYRHEAHIILAAGAPEDPDDRMLWPRYSELVPHVLAPVTDLGRCRDPAVRGFVIDIIRYLYGSGDRLLCRLAAERFIAQWQEDSGPDDLAVLDAQRYLGSALRELGQVPASYAVVEAAVRRARVVLGDRHSLTLALNSTFGANLRARGDFAQALALDEELLDLYEADFGTHDQQTLRALNDLALDCLLTGGYERARELYQRTYLLLNEAPGGGPATDILSSWSGLARAVRHTGSYAQARDVSEDAYDYGRDVLGPEHYLTLRTATDLSISLRQAGNSDEEALELARDTFEQCTRLFGADNPDTLAAAVSLANTQRAAGLIDEALPLTASAVARYGEIYGADHPYSYCCAGNLALLRRATGDYQGAREVNEAALAGLDARLTRDHLYSLTVATNLASDLASLGQTDQARELGEDTLSRLSALLGESHPLSLGCAANLALDLRTEGPVEKAGQLSEETMARYAASLGADHPAAVAAAEGRRIDADFDPPPI
jgi:Tetratricopeptide repeat/NB-ARC domain